MTANAFIGRADAPDDAALAEALGPAKSVWDQLVAVLATDHGIDSSYWKSYSRKSGWVFRVLRKKRTIVWLTPSQNCFRASFILGDKAMQAINDGHPSRRVKEATQDAVKYSEGTGLTLEVADGKAIPDVLRLTAIKIAN